MWLSYLKCQQFKNHIDRDVCFDRNNLIIGNNGSGKTNILDSIYYLSMTKSIFNSIDEYNIFHGKTHFSIEGLYKDQDEVLINCFYSKDKGKKIKKNGSPYKKLKDHIGFCPIVFMLPNDLDILRFGSELRRKLFDSTICQANKDYLTNLIEYNAIIKQRNATLKRLSEGDRVDRSLLEIYDDKIFTLGRFIFNHRIEFISIFHRFFKKRYCEISGNHEVPSIIYESHLNDDKFEIQYNKNISTDIALRSTSMGVHKDDYIFLLDKFLIKKIGSQGQQKTFMIALKLAQRDYIYEMTNIKPLILFDDIFEKLDNIRIHNLLSIIDNPVLGQVFISTSVSDISMYNAALSGLNVVNL